MLIPDFLLLAVENLCALTLIMRLRLIKQKVKIIDFRPFCFSVNYVSLDNIIGKALCKRWQYHIFW